MLRRTLSAFHVARRTTFASNAPLRCMSTETWEDMDMKYLTRNYNKDGVRGKRGLCFERGEGTYLFDTEGKRYLDCASGIAVSSIGYNHPEWVKAVQDQAALFAHSSNLFHNRHVLELGKRLVQLSKFDKVFISNSGTEANEAALKFARKYYYKKVLDEMPQTSTHAPLSPPCLKNIAQTAVVTDEGEGQRQEVAVCATRGGVCHCWPQAHATLEKKFKGKQRIIAFQEGFHGRSMGSLSMTHKPAIRAPFAPVAADVDFLPYNDMKAFDAAMGDDVLAVFVEPIQGEGGVRVGKPEFIRNIRAATKAADAVMVMDEVQAGLGRTGTLWAHEVFDVEPDVMTLAKPLAGGLPIGATLVKQHIADAIVPGDHGTTFAGGPLVTRAAVTTLDIISDPQFLKNVRDTGHYMHTCFQTLQAEFPGIIAAVRCPIQHGLMQGIELKPHVEAAKVSRELLEENVVVITAGRNTLRLVPPLIFQPQHVDELVSALRTTLRKFA